MSYAIRPDASRTKFHLRAYCVVSGALKVYLYTCILALFSSESFVLPEAGDSTIKGIYMLWKAERGDEIGKVQFLKVIQSAIEEF